MVSIDKSSEFGKRVLRRLDEELVIWLTTVSKSGAPHPRPVWFFWDGEAFHIYSQPDTYKLIHISGNDEVALNFDSDGSGGDIVVFEGTAQVLPDLPPATDDKDYIGKYRGEMEAMNMTPEDFAEGYSVPIRVKPRSLRGH